MLLHSKLLQVRDLPTPIGLHVKTAGQHYASKWEGNRPITLLIIVFVISFRL